MEHDLTPQNDDEAIPPALAMAFAPLHKRAFGFAIGIALGLTIFVATVIVLLRGPTADPQVNLGLLRQYFVGYSVTWSGALVGFAWGIVAGFVAGWFFAFCRNLAIAIAVFYFKARSELAQTRDFLDHI